MVPHNECEQIYCGQCIICEQQT